MFLSIANNGYADLQIPVSIPHKCPLVIALVISCNSTRVISEYDLCNAYINNNLWGDRPSEVELKKFMFALHLLLEITRASNDCTTTIKQKKCKLFPTKNPHYAPVVQWPKGTPGQELGR